MNTGKDVGCVLLRLLGVIRGQLDRYSTGACVWLLSNLYSCLFGGGLIRTLCQLPINNEWFCMEDSETTRK